MTLDLIIISDAKTPELREVTQRCIDTAWNHSGGYMDDVTIIVIEGNPDVVYEKAFTYYQSGDFNYNRFLNYGASLGHSKYIAFCNNDLLFSQDWNIDITEAMSLNNLDSVSPYSVISHYIHKTGILPHSGIHYGHEVKRHFEGWCFVWRRLLWEEIKLDERISFWCSDDATVEQLKAAGKTHALLSDVWVEHVHNGGHTLNTMPNRQELTIGQAKIFNRLYDKNIENAGK